MFFFLLSIFMATAQSGPCHIKQKDPLTILIPGNGLRLSLREGLLHAFVDAKLITDKENSFLLRSGLKDGDELMELNGKKIVGKFNDIWSAFNTAKKTNRWVIRRKSKIQPLITKCQ